MKNVSVKFSHAVFCLLDFMTVKDVINRMSQNVGKELPLYTV